MAHALGCGGPPGSLAFKPHQAAPTKLRTSRVRAFPPQHNRASVRIPVSASAAPQTSPILAGDGSQQPAGPPTPSRDADPTAAPSAAPAAATPSLKLACPICHAPLVEPGASSFSLLVASRRRFQCGACRRSFASAEGFVDAVIPSGAVEYVEPDLGWGGSQLFQNPLVSLAYERGWRQNFASAGFPGPEEEWAMAREVLRGAEGQAVLDVSCGSGLFTRRMAASGLFPLVVALDFSETMLRQTREFILADKGLARRKDGIALVRADVARLPFQTGSVAGVHAGAALHCWPSPHLALAEISRVLRPGAAFVATTFLSSSLPLPAVDSLLKPLRKAAVSRSRSMKSWEPEELRELCALCGLQDFQQDIRGRFIFISARKPE